MFASIIHWLEAMAQSVPLPLFVFVGGIIEEIIAPIPSPLVASLAGSIAASQELGLSGLALVCVVATIGKTLGATVFYFLGIIFKDLAVPRFGKYVGVTQNDIESFGKHFNGSKRDIFMLIVIRAIPVMPSTPISLLCGTLDINAKTFFSATLAGFYIREMTFMLIGYTGLSAVESLMSGIDTAETVLKVVIVAGAVGVLGYLFWKRTKSNPAGWLPTWRK